MLKKAFLETTILANVMLKRNAVGDAARAALANYTERLVPQFAIKEFKAGVLRNYILVHSKAVMAASYDEVVQSVANMWGGRYRQSTALQALTDFESSITRLLPADFSAKYPGQTIGSIKRAEFETWLRFTIFRAWEGRQKLGSPVRPLSCYSEVDIRLERSRLISFEPVRCDVNDCCLREQFIKRPDELRALEAACANLPKKEETGRRKRALDQLNRTPNRPLDEKQCKALGDAVFVLQCPSDAELLTTNIADHEPLAVAIGRVVRSP